MEYAEDIVNKENEDIVNNEDNEDNKNFVNEEKKGQVVEKKNNSVISPWLVTFGVTLTVVAVTCATVYIVKKNRNKELEELRYGQVYDDNMIKASFQKNRTTRFWDWTKSTAFSIKGFCSRLFTSDNYEPPIEQTDDYYGTDDEYDEEF